MLACSTPDIPSLLIHLESWKKAPQITKGEDLYPRHSFPLPVITAADARAEGGCITPRGTTSELGNASPGIGSFDVLHTCQGCSRRCSEIENFWLLPWWVDCGPEHIGQPRTPQAEAEWTRQATAIRQGVLSRATCQRYETIIKRGKEWPMDTPVKVLHFLKKCPNSRSTPKQALAAMLRVHRARNWPPPPINHHVGRDAKATTMTWVLTFHYPLYERASR